ncbi:MAG: glycosyltransferase [Solirubrobacteraceae bacterium]
MSANLRISFVTSPRGNYHMTELLEGLCAATRDAGHDATLDFSHFPPSDGDTAYVFIPHEHHGCEPPGAWPSPEQRSRTIPLCVENPYSPWFETVSELAPQFPTTLAINRSSVTALHDRGLAAEHLQLGYTEHWDSWRSEKGARPIDVVYLGAADPRRDRLIAGYARWWWHRRTSILTPVLSPKPGPQADYVVDAAKFDMLRQSKLLVNLHREGTVSFEWVRILQAVANGCVVVSEPAPDHAPMVAGEHFIAADAASIPHIVEALLDEPERLDTIRSAAYAMVTERLTMSSTVEQIVAVAQELVSGRGALVGGRGRKRAITGPRANSPATSPEPASDGNSAVVLRRAIRGLATDVLELRRLVEQLQERVDGRGSDVGPELVAATPSFEPAIPRVSVTITLRNYEREVLDALASVDSSEFTDYEVLVLDDASTDGSLASVRGFLRDRPWMPAALLRHRTNRGLGASRNALSRQARGELMFVLDADNLIFPNTLGRLVAALDADPGATFAYPLIAVERFGQPVGLLSRFAWDPRQLRGGNYIDAMAMIRLDALDRVGGYTEDVRLTGWEDFHLWCACAEAHLRGRLVPEVLARYRQVDHSMLGGIVDYATAWSVLRARFPALLPDDLPA